MTRVGIRELRQNASAIIRRVLDGENVEVTDRGRPVARIVPLRSRGGLDQMIDEGRASQSRIDLLKLKALPKRAGQPTLSDVLNNLRADER